MVPSGLQQIPASLFVNINLGWSKGCRILLSLLPPISTLSLYFTCSVPNHHLPSAFGMPPPFAHLLQCQLCTLLVFDPDRCLFHTC